MESKEKNSRSLQAAETRLLVFNTALRLLDENRFEDIKVRNIATAAGVSVGTFYHYFSSKLDVYYETYCLSDDYFENTVRLHMTQPHIADRLYYFFDQYAAYSADYTSLKLTKILYNSSNTCFVRESKTGLLPLLISTLRQGLKDGQLRTEESAEEIADFLMISMRGQVYDWCIRDGSYNLRDAVGAHIRKLMKIYL